MIARIPSSRRGDFHGLIASVPPAARGRFPELPESCGDDLTWVHDVPRIERLFDAPHQIDAATELEPEEFHLAPPHPVLARAGAVHGDGPHDQALVERLNAGHLVRVLAVAEQDDVEIPIPDMADDWTVKARLGEVGLGLDD